MFLSERNVLAMLRQAVEAAGNQSEWSHRTGIDRSYVNQVLHGKKRSTQVFLRY